MIPIKQLHWRREYGEIPNTATYDRSNRLILHRINNDDTGRYICQKTSPDGTVTQDYLDVILKREYRRSRPQPDNLTRWRRYH